MDEKAQREVDQYGVAHAPIELPKGWKPPRPPPNAREFSALLEGSIKEMGLTGAEAAAMRQKYRAFIPPSKVPKEDPRKPIDPALADTLAGKVGDQLGLDIDQLKKRMGI